MADPFDFSELDLYEAADQKYLTSHGLDRPLKIRFDKYDWTEIERQVRYLLQHHTEIPKSVATRRAGFLLAHYMSGREPPSPDIVLLVGTLLEVSAYPIKYAKKPASRIHAQAYLKENPKASNGEIARVVGVNKSTVGRWRRDGHL